MAVRLGVHERRRLVSGGALALCVLALLLGTRACGSADDGARAQQRTPERRPPARLPDGTRTLFPLHRIVALYGNPRARQLGELGIGSPDAAGNKLLRQAGPYVRWDRPVLPAMELIATLATNAPGDDGKYRINMPDEMIATYLKAARRVHGILILDVQPGRDEFGPLVERLERWLRLPDVGLALDPEWKMQDGEVPGSSIGKTDADVVNATAAYLSKIVAAGRLPEKPLIIHRFTDGMIEREERLREFPGVRTIINIDGFGGPAVKVAKYKALTAREPSFPRGFKLFYEEDRRDGQRLMTPRQVMRLRPVPDVVLYE